MVASGDTCADQFDRLAVKPSAAIEPIRLPFTDRF
jgi:hypothetical protein